MKPSALLKGTGFKRRAKPGAHEGAQYLGSALLAILGADDVVWLAAYSVANPLDALMTTA